MKCPKCRLSFEVVADAGMTEVQCNCPRCGTPFAYAAAREAEAHDATGLVDAAPGAGGDAAVGMAVPDAAVEGVGQESLPAGEEATSDGYGVMPVRTAVRDNGLYGYSHGNGVFARRGRGGVGRGATLAAGFVAAMAVAALIAVGADRLMGHFTEHDEELMEQLAVVPDSTMADSVEAGGGKDARAASVARARNGNGGKKRQAKDVAETDGEIPAWVCGVWHAMTDNNYVTVRIAGGKIKVSDFYHANTGRMTLSGNTLVCRFRDGTTATYAIDRERHRIVGSNGLVLEK